MYVAWLFMEIHLLEVHFSCCEDAETQGIDQYAQL